MEIVERSARTVDEAIELALMELNVDRTEVEVEILNKGKAGFLGIGGELARVKVSLGKRPAPPKRSPAKKPAVPKSTSKPRVAAVKKPAPRREPNIPKVESGEPVDDSEMTALAMTTVNDILTATKVDVICNINEEYSTPGSTLAIELSGNDTGLLIGRRGQTLMSLQFLVNSIVRTQTGTNTRIVIDAEGYRDRRETTLKEMAIRVADRVKQTGRSVTLEPMNAADRRIIHVSLTEYDGIKTESIGEADNRKVEIYLDK
ncbi:MAG TPA: hypothetical protein DEZ08_00770 [Dehalococcoidia bacterium]|jgi:spoIIIJ-associated protein|nr:hypothetical protein [Dehalococcoidia bacterium]